MSSIPNLKYKTTLCNNWTYNNDCIKGQSCFFAHGYQQLRTMEQNQEQIQNKIHNAKNTKFKSVPLNNYKTIYCKFYKKGQCQLGDKCTFIHDKKQRRVRKLQKNQPISNDMSWHDYSQMCWIKSNTQNFAFNNYKWQMYYPIIQNPSFFNFESQQVESEKNTFIKLEPQKDNQQHQEKSQKPAQYES